MPSVRVKRDPGYTTLRDTLDIPDVEQPTTRPRSRSFAGLFAPASPPPPDSDVPRAIQADHARRRAQTISVREHQQRGSIPVPSSPRPPGRVSSHIMNRASRAVASTSDDMSERVGSSLMSGARRSASVRSRPSRASMLSLEGQHENILIPEDVGHEPGRISSALSVHSENPEDLYDDDDDEHHHDDIVEHLDVIDPQIATVSMLTNAANSIVIPPLSFYSRKPVIVLSSVPPRQRTDSEAEKGSPDFSDNLDRHVEEVLRKRDKFRRVMRGVWSFLKTPMGIVVGIYGFMIIFWGSGIVLFLAKIINLHDKINQGYWVELCQQVETGLFTLTSIGLIPFRALDTYRIYLIWYYKRRTRILRAKAGLPQLYDVDDLPDPAYDENYVHVLSAREQADLHYQQYKFSQSQTWYRPHGTQTHRAFPINIALTICLLNDLNSFFQILLSACMWSLNRFQRPAWTTATTLPLAFVAGIAAGVYIWWGGKKTKRNEAVEARLRSALAMERPRRGANNPTIKVVTADGESAEPTTVGSTPVMPAEPQCQDFALSDSTVVAGSREGSEKEKAKEKELPAAPISPRMESVASIPISDSMTVPPATTLHNGVRMR